MVDPIRAFQSAMLATLGHAPEHIEPGKFHRFSTNGKRSDKAGWCRLFEDLRGGVFGCHRLRVSESWTSQEHPHLSMAERAELARKLAMGRVDREEKQRQLWAENSLRNARIWAESQPLQPGDPVRRYLQRRGLASSMLLPSCLRLHPSLSYWDGSRELGRFVAMVAPLTDNQGNMLALHRTYLTAEGCKADVPMVKKVTCAAAPLVGTGIPLGQPDGGVIGVAEGIETALAAWAASGIPTVATYCANGLANWHWPAEARRLIVFADHDRAGLEAADILKFRARRAGLQCEVVPPREPGLDWCDVWQAQQSEPVLAGGAE